MGRSERPDSRRIGQASLQDTRALLNEAGASTDWVKRQAAARLEIGRPTLDRWIRETAFPWPRTPRGRRADVERASAARMEEADVTIQSGHPGFTIRPDSNAQDRQGLDELPRQTTFPGMSPTASAERERRADLDEPPRRAVTWTLAEECVLVVEHEAVERRSHPRDIVEQIIRQALIYPKKHP